MAVVICLGKSEPPLNPPNKDIVIFVSDTPVVFYNFVYPAKKKKHHTETWLGCANVEAPNKLFADKSPPHLVSAFN